MAEENNQKNQRNQGRNGDELFGESEEEGGRIVWQRRTIRGIRGIREGMMTNCLGNQRRKEDELSGYDSIIISGQADVRPRFAHHGDAESYAFKNEQ